MDCGDEMLDCSHCFLNGLHYDQDTELQDHTIGVSMVGNHNTYDEDMGRLWNVEHELRVHMVGHQTRLHYTELLWVLEIMYLQIYIKIVYWKWQIWWQWNLKLH
jgi:hypothetical protein